MSLSIEEQIERRKLVGFCEHCQEWYNLTDDPDSPESRRHSCGDMPSHKVGFQLTTQRTFNAKAKKLSKAQLKRMSAASS